jgi:putative holliday junction resolvase
MPDMHKTILAFDFGEQRIGIAVGQSITGQASALATIGARSRAERLEKIASYIHDWQPAVLVVGQPLYPDGKANPMTALAAKFARQISEHFKLPYVLVDERYTSVVAAQELSQRNYSSRDSASGVDATAAALIAEQYFAQLALSSISLSSLSLSNSS